MHIRTASLLHLLYNSDVLQQAGRKQKYKHPGERELEDLQVPQHLGAGKPVWECSLRSACRIQAGMDMSVY